MTINIKAAQEIAKAVMYYDREISREIIHAIEYYKSFECLHSKTRLLNAVNAAVRYAGRTYGFCNTEVVHKNFADVMEAAA